MRTVEISPRPPRFEDEFPEEAAILSEACNNRNMRIKLAAGRKANEYPFVRLKGIGGMMQPMMFKFHNHGGHNLPAYTEPIKRDNPKIGRNQPCPCGSGLKFKKCCG